MQFAITPMITAHARCILEWKYDGPYAFYNYDKSIAHILDESQWGRTLFAVLDEAGALVGELTLGFLDANNKWVPQAEMDAGRLEGCMLWIGFGMRPDLTGRGLGLGFVSACASFAAHLARERCHYTGDYIGLSVYQFNQRAIKVYERAGFQTFFEGSAEVGGKTLKMQRMKKRI